MHRSPSAQRHAFTLIELLVVVSIIAVLISLLMPVLGMARDSAKSLICRTNLRQIGLASAGYTLDHEGQMVPVKMYQPNGIGTSWMSMLAPYIEAANDANRNGEAEWGEYKTNTVIKCPIYKYAPTAWQPGYAMNNFLLLPLSQDNNSSKLDGTSWIGAGEVVNLLEMSITNKATRILVADTSNDENLWGSNDCTYRHRKRTGALLCDGHVELLTLAQATIAISTPAKGW